MEVVSSQKVVVSCQKYSRTVLKTCVGPFGVNMKQRCGTFWNLVDL